jgi:hypothetical protein
MFKKYQHIERFGCAETDGIEFGTTHVFPKIDGTNGSIWSDGCGSRNRELSLDNDNQGFMAWVDKNPAFPSFFEKYPNIRLYGEWLVPHSLKTYKESAWRDFYVFDVVDDSKDGTHYVSYDLYKGWMEEFNINYIPPICRIVNGTYEQFIEKLHSNVFLIEDGKGTGEGIVIKNYDYRNKYGRQTWAKIVTSEFKEKHAKMMDSPLMAGRKMIEQEISDKYCTTALIEKVYAKIVIEGDGWSSKYIPRLLNTVYYDIINEDCWHFVKEHKNPKIDFKTLNHFVTAKIKQVKSELF